MKRQLSALIVSRGLGSLAQAVSMALVARSVSIAEFGWLSIAVAVMSIVVLVFDFGVSPQLVRSHAANGHDQVGRLLLISRYSTAALVFLVAAVSCGISAFAGDHWWLIVLVIALATEKNVEAQTGLLVAEGRALAPALVSLTRRLFVTAVTFQAFLWWTPYTLIAFCGASLVAVIASVPLVGRLIRGVGAAPAKTLTLKDARTLLRSGSTFLAGNVSGMVRMVDVLVVSTLGGAAMAGIYSAGSKLASPLFLIPQSLASVMLPRSTRGNNDQAKRDAKRLTILGLALSLGSILLSPLSPWLVQLVYGERYVEAWPILVITMVSFPWVALSSTLGSILQGRSEERFVARNGLANAVVTALLMVIGFVLFDAVGVAVGLVVGYALKFGLLLRRIWGLI